MDVRLRPELEKFVNSMVQKGYYPSAEEALNQAVQMLKEREEAETELEAMLQEAEDSGPATDMTAQDLSALRQRDRSSKSGPRGQAH
jgi:putative addiction module CopG family antidote